MTADQRQAGEVGGTTAIYYCEIKAGTVAKREDSKIDPPNRGSNFVRWGNCRKKKFNSLVKINIKNQVSSLEFLVLF